MNNEVIDLVNERTKLNKWFNEYLDANSEMMSDYTSTHPVWKPYNENMARYSEIEDRLRILNVSNSK